MCKNWLQGVVVGIEWVTGNSGQGGGHPLLPFLGRRTELEKLEASLLSHEPLLVVGDPGLGKSRLLAEANNRFGTAVTWFVVKASPESTHAPYDPIRGLAQQARTILDPHGLGWTERAVATLDPLFSRKAPPDAPFDEEGNRHGLWLSWQRYCQALAGACPGPVALVLEDAHWADQETLALWAWLATQNPRAVHIASCRPPVPEHLATMSDLLLGPLDADSVAAVIRDMDLDADAESVIRVTGGNPLHFSRWVANRSTSLPGGSQLNDGSASIDPVSAESVAAAALVGTEFDLSMVATITERSPLETSDHLRFAVLASLLNDLGAGRFAFSHEMVRDEAVAQIDAATRCAFHRRIARELERRHGREPTILARLAHHATEASIDGDRALAIDCHLAAGQHARRSLAPTVARHHLQLALELAQMDGDPQRTLEIRLDLGLALASASDPSTEPVLAQVYDEAAALGDAVVYARAALAQPASAGAAGLSVMGDPAAAHRLREAERRLPPGHPLLVGVYAELAMQQHATLRHSEYFAYVEQAEELAQRSGDPNSVLTAFVARYSARRPAGALAACRQAFESHLNDIAPDSSFRLTLLDVGLVAALRAGDIPVVIELMHRIKREFDPLPPIARWTLLRTEAALAHASGDIERFEQLALDAMTAASGTRNAQSASSNFGFQVATIMRERRQLDEAKVAVGLWVEEHPTYLAYRAARAWRNADAGDAAAASADLDYMFAQDLVEYSGRVEGLLAIAMAAAASARIGDADLSRQAHALMSPFRSEWIVIGNGTVIDGPTLRPMALASSACEEHTRALDEIDRAIAMTIRAGLSHLTTTCMRDRAVILQNAGRVTEGRAMFIEAADRYEHVGLTAHAAQLRDLASEAGVQIDQNAVHDPGITASLSPVNGGFLVGHEARETQLPNLKGLRMIRFLLQNPGTALSASDLSHWAEHGTVHGDTTKGGVGVSRQRVIDETAKTAYKARISELAREIQRADRRGDVEASVGLHDELAAITRELDASTGLAGKIRPAPGAVDERARVRVQKSIRTAIRHINDDLPELAEHLRRSISTGNSCAYDPDPRATVHWTT